jgi:hypothetical protein
MSRRYTTSPPQAPPWHVEGLLYFYFIYRPIVSPGVKARPGRDADHSPPSSAEVENE